MQFNPDPKKQVNEVIFSRKTSSNNLSYPPIKLNNNEISKCPHQKQLGIVWDSKLKFNDHADQKVIKCNRIIGPNRRLLIILPRNALLTIYKSFVRPYLDYGDFLYGKPTKQWTFSEQIRKSSV